MKPFALLCGSNQERRENGLRNSVTEVGVVRGDWILRDLTCILLDLYLSISFWGCAYINCIVL